MRTADEILDDELSENMLDYLKENQIFREWIKDAMYTYAKEYHDSEVKKLNFLAVSVNEVELCTCGNPSGEGNIQMVDDEKMLYFCCDCGKKVQNL